MWYPDEKSMKEINPFFFQAVSVNSSTVESGLLCKRYFFDFSQFDFCSLKSLAKSSLLATIAEMV